MKKLTTLSIAGLLTLSTGAFVFANNAKDTVKFANSTPKTINSKQMNYTPNNNFQKHDFNMMNSHMQGMTPESFKQMVDIQKDRLQQAINDGSITEQQADLWKNNINSMEDYYKNNQSNPSEFNIKGFNCDMINSHMQGMTPESFKQMVDIQKDRLQQAINDGSITEQQSQYWKNHINNMENYHETNEFNNNTTATQSDVKNYINKNNNQVKQTIVNQSNNNENTKNAINTNQINNNEVKQSTISQHHNKESQHNNMDNHRNYQ